MNYGSGLASARVSAWSKNCKVGAWLKEYDEVYGNLSPGMQQSIPSFIGQDDGHHLYINGELILAAEGSCGCQ